jgi:hypothetical protein
MGTTFSLYGSSRAPWPEALSSDETLGFAQQCPENERACVLNIFYSRVDELAVQGRARGERILGHAMADDIGHLLLGPNAHSPRGIMRGLWFPRLYSRAAGRQPSAGSIGAVMGHCIEGNRRAWSSLMNSVDDDFE